MTDLPFPDRIHQLRQRWDADPSSRLFLQLAEEYRHLGRLKEALAVLDSGLKEHPGYLSALVAKGRCHLELGQPAAAREVLERVVRQDATQMVANKLLVRAYLDLAEPERARERLDLYSLLHDGDPEVEELRRRIAQAAAAPAPAAAPPAISAPPVITERDEGVFDLPPAGKRLAGGEVFDIGPGPAHRPAPVEDLFGIYAAPEPVPAPAGPLVEAAPENLPFALAEAEEPEEPEDGAIFPGLATRARRKLWLERLASEGIFGIGIDPIEAGGSIETASVGPTASMGSTPAEAEEVWPGELEPAVAEEPDVMPFLEAAPPAEEPAPEPATATLGELYLRQGHRDEAERIFREVLGREPGNPAALDGLERLAAPAPEVVAAPEAAALPADPRSRKVLLLSAYLDRIKRGSAQHVP